jgi:four helix bundle protein
MKMEKKPRKISDRLLDFSVEVIRIVTNLNKNIIGRTIAKQLLRAGTSAGANYEETYGAESRADFIHKLQIVLKELKESLYWFKLIKKSEILKQYNIEAIIDETEQLCKIIAQSVITTKNNRQF